MPFQNKQGQNQTANNQQPSLPFTLVDYLELVDWTGRCIRPDKRGHISNTLPPILQRLDIHTDAWLQTSTRFEENYYKAFDTQQTWCSSS